MCDNFLTELTSVDGTPGSEVIVGLNGKNNVDRAVRYYTSNTMKFSL